MCRQIRRKPHDIVCGRRALTEGVECSMTWFNDASHLRWRVASWPYRGANGWSRKF